MGERFSRDARRPATSAEARALANPLRLRILRRCLDVALTNKQLADHLGLNPGTTLHHVRILLDTDFLEVEEIRPGPRGSTEKLLRATGKSWVLDVSRSAGDVSVAVLDAVREELREAGPRALINDFRLAVRLRRADLGELEQRLTDLVMEFDRRDCADGEPVALYTLLHARPTPRGSDAARPPSKSPRDRAQPPAVLPSSGPNQIGLPLGEPLIRRGGLLKSRQPRPR